VYLTFDTEMTNRRHDVAFPRECVRDYELSYDHGCGAGPAYCTSAAITNAAASIGSSRSPHLALG